MQEASGPDFIFFSVERVNLDRAENCIQFGQKSIS